MMKWKKKVCVCVKENLSIGHKNWTMKWFKTKNEKETQQDVELRCLWPQRMSHVYFHRRVSTLLKIIFHEVSSTLSSKPHIQSSAVFCSDWLIMVNNSCFLLGSPEEMFIFHLSSSGQFNSEPTQTMLEINKRTAREKKCDFSS